MQSLVKLTEKDRLIISELIKDSRISDNQIAKNTGIPVKTINRRRHSLEEKNVVNYFTFVDNFSVTKKFSTRQMFIVRFNLGLTRQNFLDVLFENKDLFFKKTLMKHLLESHLAEEHGQLVLVLILESFQKNDLVEIFNEDIVKFFNKVFEKNVVSRTEVIDMTYTLNRLHNYVYLSDKGISDKPSTFRDVFVSE